MTDSITALLKQQDDEIERIRAEIERLTTALRIMTKLADQCKSWHESRQTHGKAERSR